MSAPRGEAPDLTIFCDRQQLDSMIKHGYTERPLRFAAAQPQTGSDEAARKILERLSALAKPSVTWLDARTAAAS